MYQILTKSIKQSLNNSNGKLFESLCDKSTLISNDELTTHGTKIGGKNKSFQTEKGYWFWGKKTVESDILLGEENFGSKFFFG